MAVGSAELAEHAPEVPELNESGAHREIDADTNEQINEDVAIEGIAQRVDQPRLNEVQIPSPTCAAVRSNVNAKC